MLLSLLPPSCMVVPIRELANIHFSTSASSSKPFTMATLPSNIDIDIDSNIIRRRSVFYSKMNSRELSILSNTSFAPYHEKMEYNNNLPNEEIWDSVNSSQLSYKENIKIGKLVRIATNNSPQEGLQHVPNKTPALKNILKL